MIRLVWSVLVLIGCGQSQVIESPYSGESNSKLGSSPLAKSDHSITFFAWSIRAASGQNVDHFSDLDPTTQRALAKLTQAENLNSSEQISIALRSYATRMIGAATDRTQVLAHQGQLKHHDIDSTAGESQVIRSISQGDSLGLAGCYEMRKVFTESRPSAQWLDPKAAESWRRVGLSQTAPALPSSTLEETKAFLFIDLTGRMSRLYMYEESNESEQRELTEVVVSCPIGANHLNL
jgi:hypothetical protein